MRKLPYAFSLVALLVSCDGSEPADAGTSLELANFEREMLASIGTNVIVPSLEAFVVAAEGLETATAAYAADPSADNRTAAQTAWGEALDRWQLVEMMQVGPAGMGGTTGVVGGLDVRDEIYTYEQSSTCRIDQETVETVHTDPDAFAAELVNVRGLDAAEYLLFVESTENTCSTMSPINLEGTWDALGADGVRDARAVYAATVAVLVLRDARRLRDAWIATGEDFLGTFSSAGLDGNAYPSVQVALNDLAGAMLYLDTDTRDMKLAEPAGIAGCLEATCPDALEHPFAARGGSSITQNMEAFQLLYLGGPPATPDALGWDDLLDEVGAAELSDQLEAAIAAAVTACDALGPSLAGSITTDPALAQAAYDAISEVLRLFKADFFTVLDIEPSGPRIGDND